MRYPTAESILDKAQQALQPVRCLQEDAVGMHLQKMKLAHMIRVWAAVNGVQHAQLAEEWKCGASTVTRFLKDAQSPDGPTMGRVIAWVLSEQPAEQPVDVKELERRIDRLERLYQGDRAAVNAASMFIPIGGDHG